MKEVDITQKSLNKIFLKSAFIFYSFTHWSYIYAKKKKIKHKHKYNYTYCDGYCIFVLRLHYPETPGRISGDSTVPPKL